MVWCGGAFELITVLVRADSIRKPGFLVVRLGSIECGLKNLLPAVIVPSIVALVVYPVDAHFLLSSSCPLCCCLLYMLSSSCAVVVL